MYKVNKCKLCFQNSIDHIHYMAVHRLEGTIHGCSCTYVCVQTFILYAGEGREECY